MQTGSPEHMEQFKAEQIKRLTESSWDKKVSAELVRSTMPRFDELLEKTIAKHEALSKELGEIDPQDHTRETRERKKKLEVEIRDCDAGITYIEDKIATIGKQIKHLDEQSQAEAKRAEYMEQSFPACLDIKSPEVEEPVAEQALKV